jgi:hypothetical protein
MTGKRKWGDFSARQQRGMQLLGLVQVALLVSALWDIWHSSPDDINGDRRVWTAVSFVNIVGPLAYFIVGRKGREKPPVDGTPVAG